ncbi:hypothetical protein L1049_026924 [Liquidambar formosana]|uniref:J domain-containing protein n=1 Tax=Liquidambar formosana TaxID=63359 RepID=A0AAP0R7Q6_LIQFO
MEEHNPSTTPATSTHRAEAERLLGIAEKLLQNRDLTGSRDFAVLAQETEPLLDGSDQILAVADVLLASEKRINNHHDWYAILQIDRRSDDLDLVKKQYRRLALLLHPDKNKFAFADQAFKLVADAWAVLSDSSKKSLYDNELSLYSKIDLVAMRTEREQQQAQAAQQQQQNMQQGKLPVRRSPRGGSGGSSSSSRKKGAAAAAAAAAEEPSINKLSSFWTACPYCYRLYEYPRVYEGCCLRCQNCQRAFHAALIPSLPPLVPGKDAYYCCWGFFPLGFMIANSEGGGKGGAAAPGGFPNWMPPMFRNSRPGNESNPAAAGPNVGVEGYVEVSDGAASAELGTKKKRGRPRKVPLQA